jgi:hypothetical protein
VAGSGALTLTVNGSNFVSGSTVQWNGSVRTTTFVSSAQLSAAIPSSDTATGSTAQVTVQNPGAVASSAVSFAVHNPAPTVTSISPATATAGDPAFTLTVNGSNFVSTSTVQWNGQTRTTTFVSASQLTASVTAADVATGGSAQVAVANPTPGGGTSNAIALTIDPRVGVVQVASLTNTGSLGNSDVLIEHGTSSTGRFVAFASTATNLVTGDTNGFADAFLRDTCLGAPTGCTPRTIRVSVASDGTQGNANDLFMYPKTSADGRYVAFLSNASNLVSGDTNAVPDFFLRDTCVGASAGCSPSTQRVSVASSGTQANAGFLSPPAVFATPGPSMSADGRFIAFVSLASNLVPNDTNMQQDVFVRDTCIGAPGCTPSTIRVSFANGGGEANGPSMAPVISADGRFAAFDSNATNLVPGVTSAGSLYLRDTCLNAPPSCTPSTMLISAAANGSAVVGGISSLSAHGRFVAFQSGAASIVSGDTNGRADIFLRDTCFGAPAGCVPSTTRVSLTQSGAELNGDSTDASVSADGRVVAFISSATNLITTDTNGVIDVFVRDTCFGATGCTPSTVLASVSPAGAQGFARSLFPSLASSGEFITFESPSNFLSSDTNSAGDILLAKTGVTIAPQIPSITALSPANATAGSAELTLTVAGSGFSPRSVVRWNGSDRTTLYVSSTMLYVRIPASDLASAGSAQVTVFNPGSGGGTSNAVTFTVN